MIAHKNFESDCKRIAKTIMKIASDPSDDKFDDMICYGKVTVNVSSSLVEELNKDKWKHHKEWQKEINKNLDGCSVSIDSVGTSGECFICLSVEFDDVDAEFEDW